MFGTELRDLNNIIAGIDYLLAYTFNLMTKNDGIPGAGIDPEFIETDGSFCLFNTDYLIIC